MTDAELLRLEASELRIEAEAEARTHDDDEQSMPIDSDMHVETERNELEITLAPHDSSPDLFHHLEQVQFIDTSDERQPEAILEQTEEAKPEMEVINNFEVDIPDAQLHEVDSETEIDASNHLRSQQDSEETHEIESRLGAVDHPEAKLSEVAQCSPKSDVHTEAGLESDIEVKTNAQVELNLEHSNNLEVDIESGPSVATSKEIEIDSTSMNNVDSVAISENEVVSELVLHASTNHDTAIKQSPSEVSSLYGQAQQSSPLRNRALISTMDLELPIVEFDERAVVGEGESNFSPPTEAQAIHVSSEVTMPEIDMFEIIPSKRSDMHKTETTFEGARADARSAGSVLADARLSAFDLLNDGEETLRFDSQDLGTGAKPVKSDACSVVEREDLGQGLGESDNNLNDSDEEGDSSTMLEDEANDPDRLRNHDGNVTADYSNLLGRVPAEQQLLDDGEETSEETVRMEEDQTDDFLQDEIEVDERPESADPEMSVLNESQEGKQDFDTSTADEITSAQIDEETTTVKVQLNDDDTMYLQDFVLRAHASKVDRTAKRLSNSNKRDSNAVKEALASPDRPALHELDTNSPLNSPLQEIVSPTKEFKSSSNEVYLPSPLNRSRSVSDDGKIDATNHVTPSRRSGRDHFPKEAPAIFLAIPQQLSVRRADGTERFVLKRSEAQEVAAVTRGNTRRNKGSSLSVRSMLIKINDPLLAEDLLPETFETPAKLRNKAVTWNPQLVAFETAPAPVFEEPVDAASKASQFRAERARARALVEINGTPGRPRTLKRKTPVSMDDLVADQALSEPQTAQTVDALISAKQTRLPIVALPALPAPTTTAPAIPGLAVGTSVTSAVRLAGAGSGKENVPTTEKEGQKTKSRRRSMLPARKTRSAAPV